MISLGTTYKTPYDDMPAGGKLLLLCMVTVVLFSFEALRVQLTAFVFCALLYLLPGRAFLLSGVRRLVFLWPFLLVLAVFHWLGNTPVEALSIALRLLTTVALANLVTMTTALSDIVAVFNLLLFPLRKIGVNTRPAELAVGMVIRFTPVFVSKAATLKQAWRARSAKRAGWRLVQPLLLVAIDDAEQVADALRARGGAYGT